jgi:hypothetical protein
VVLLLFSFVAIFALVVDVGAWIRAQRQAQAVADAAALAGAQDLPSGPAAADTKATDYANENWPGVDVDVSSAANSIAVDVQHDVPGLFSKLVGLTSVRIRAHATARIEVPRAVNAVAPLALECRDPCIPWPAGVHPFQFRSRNPGGSSLAPVSLPDVNSWSEFSSYVSCDARTPADCNPTPATAGTGYSRFSSSSTQLYNALQGAGSAPHLVAVFDRYTSGQYHVVGWATIEITDVDLVRSSRRRRVIGVDIDARFVPLMVAGSWLSSSGTGSFPPDLGVRAVGLTK